jgi:hypothetical protein
MYTGWGRPFGIADRRDPPLGKCASIALAKRWNSFISDPLAIERMRGVSHLATDTRTRRKDQ